MRVCGPFFYLPQFFFNLKTLPLVKRQGIYYSDDVMKRHFISREEWEDKDHLKCLNRMINDFTTSINLTHNGM